MSELTGGFSFILGKEKFHYPRHAAERALQMRVTFGDVKRIVAFGDVLVPKYQSKYPNPISFRLGDVTVSTFQRPGGERVIGTLNWASLEAWRRAPEMRGRKYRGDLWTERALASWRVIRTATKGAGCLDGEAGFNKKMCDYLMVEARRNGMPLSYQQAKARLATPGALDDLISRIVAADRLARDAVRNVEAVAA